MVFCFTDGHAKLLLNSGIGSRSHHKPENYSFRILIFGNESGLNPGSFIETTKISLKMKAHFYMVIVCAICLTGPARAQSRKSLPRWLDRVVVEASAIPVSWSDLEPYNITWYNFAVGYALGPRFELSYNRDLLNVFRDDDYFEHNRKLRSLGLAGNYRFYTITRPGYFNGISFSARLKAGITISIKEKEQQSFFYDISGRIYPHKNYFLAAGFNQDVEGDWYFFIKPSGRLNTFYLSFGLSF